MDNEENISKYEKKDNSMKDLDEKVKKLMSKKIKSKTILVSIENFEKIKIEHENDGWQLVKTTEINGKYKVTFQQIE